MSLPVRPQLPAYNSQHNQLPQRTEQYLNMLGNWHTYRNATTMADVFDIVGQVTRAAFGVDLAGGRLSLTGILGAIMALHALERVTAAAATLGIRAAGNPHQILAWHHGVALRPSPIVPRAAQAMHWLLGSRLVSAAGWYFHEAGRTWHYQVLTLHLWGADRTLAHLRSVSLPHRAYYFDRDINWAVAIELALGHKLAELTLGHLGSINELEHAVGVLARAKLIYIAANWLLIDPTERTAAAAPRQPAPSGWSGSASAAGSARNNTTSAPPPMNGPATQLPLMMRAPQPNGDHGRSAAQPPGGDWVKNRYYLNGYSYPLLVRQVVINPITRQRRADAIYYDGQQWQPVSNDADCIALADDFDNGRLHPQPWPQAA